ncbi:hypothetical protein HCN44_010727 [Aphidius gifuensis]|uniref:Uncharacterized protein n=1 Tax=Aphidius gifuensis TaxID=684658 RepID=A0A834XTH7_APHGI|nr:ribonucleases P/MRP protein subunit POP1 [Aphidius gifuensis]KAF7991926.1 hypothetical protein HCN44_010727 [Aphidius gifuensis]
MEKLQFDELLGGGISLPREVKISKLTSSRASEIAAITHSLENPQHTKLVFQKLPVHMRRRVMSHNAKRMPRRLREAHINQMTKSGLPPKTKKPSRNYRRRPKNLLDEYNRRKRNKIWLETHIWHAKRFHMCEKWGYKIANYSNNRGYRSSYRAVAKHCMIQDISYYNIIQLTGSYSILIDKLKVHCKEGLTFGAKIYKNGERQGTLMFYKKNNIPIGFITFLWQPFEQNNIKTLWINSHPSFSKYIIEELISSFEFEATIDDTNKFFNNQNLCRMELLMNSLNRFRLRGPLTISVLSDTLKLPNIAKIIDDKNTTGGDDGDDDGDESNDSQSWDKNWYSNPDNVLSFNQQKDAFLNVQSLNSPGQLPRHSVLSLTVLDPRFYLPQKRTKQMLGSDHYKTIYKFDKNVADSPLWNENIRNYIKDNFKTTNDINKLRSGNLVPGVQNDHQFDENIISKIPIIIIQYPGSDYNEKSFGFTSGVDIILPSNWAIPFLMAFMYRCVRPIGLREFKSVLFENLMLNTPEINHPDTQAYQDESQEIKKQLQDLYFRYPPNRRINYTKFSITSPFFCQWSILINEWTNENNISVLRDHKLITMIDQKIKKLTINEKPRKSNLSIAKNDYDVKLLDDKKSFLILIKITIIGKGRPKNFSLICQPSKEDIERKLADKKWNGPVEKLKSDEFEKKRKLVRQKHKIFLKKSMRKRSRDKKNNVKITNDKYNTNEEKIKHKKIMEEFYLPECKIVKKSCDRDVMGYIVQGDFSFTESKGIGWGYIVVQSLIELINNNSNIVLVRNTQTRQYRFAKIDIINMN